MRVACVQKSVVFNDPEANARSLVSDLQALKAEGVELAVFPEACLTGYCVESRAMAEKIALDTVVGENQTIVQAHPEVERIRRACIELEIHAVFGFASREAGELVNTAALAEPNGQLRRYNKVHLPELGYDHFSTPGNELPVFDTAIGKIGILICYDLRIPEAARVLALKGAEIIVLPTNWPVGAEVVPRSFVATRAAENRVFIATCNRMDGENGFQFIGNSGIYDVTGDALVTAKDVNTVITADINLDRARSKRNVVSQGRFESTVFGCRRPDLYGPIVGGE